MLISLEEFKNSVEYQNFLKENPSTGLLKVQAFTAYGAIPIADTDIFITKTFGNERVVFFHGRTDSSGIIDNIELPAPVAVNTTTPEIAPTYTLYNITAIHEGYESIKQYSIAIFGEIKVIQYIKMTPEITLEGEIQNGN